MLDTTFFWTRLVELNEPDEMHVFVKHVHTLCKFQLYSHWEQWIQIFIPSIALPYLLPLPYFMATLGNTSKDHPDLMPPPCVNKSSLWKKEDVGCEARISFCITRSSISYLLYFSAYEACIGGFNLSVSGYPVVFLLSHPCFVILAQTNYHRTLSSHIMFPESKSKKRFVGLTERLWFRTELQEQLVFEKKLFSCFFSFLLNWSNPHLPYSLKFVIEMEVGMLS